MAMEINIDELIDTHYNSTLVLFLLDISIVLVVLLFLAQHYFDGICLDKNNAETMFHLKSIFTAEIVLLCFFVFNFIQLRKLFATKSEYMRENIFKVLSVLFGCLTIIYIALFYYFEQLKTVINLNCPFFSDTFRYLIYFQLIFFSVSYIFIFHKVFVSIVKGRTV